MKQSNTSKYAYFAGLFDGEGTIGIYLRKDSKVLDASRIAIGQKNGIVIDWLYGNFGGQINFKDKRKYAPKSSTENKTLELIHVWYTSDINKIEEILKKSLPFLKGKKTQAQIMLEYCTAAKRFRKQYESNGFIKVAPQKEIERWNKKIIQYSKRLKEEKNKFTQSAAVETKFPNSYLFMGSHSPTPDES